MRLYPLKNYLKNWMRLGILYKDGVIVNHRSLLKVLTNPILRRFGYYIGSVCENNEIIGIKLVKGIKSKSIKWDFKSHNEYDIIIKKRLIY